MKVSELHRALGEQTIFRSGMLLAGQRSPADVRRQLSRWVKSGKVLSLRKGVYLLAEPYACRQPHPFVLANELRRASYVSLQSALAWHGCIPEFVPATTSVTTERPEQLDTPKGRFIFRHIKRDLLWGMTRLEVSPAQFALVATPEKALIDLLYLTPDSDQPEYLEELRIESAERLRLDVLSGMAKRSGSKKVMRAVEHLTTLWRESPWGERL